MHYLLGDITAFNHTTTYFGLTGKTVKHFRAAEPEVYTVSTAYINKAVILTKKN
jgi:hypothetical protein